MLKIFVTGGCGYKGSLLIKKLLELGYKVINIDAQWFGSKLQKNKNLLNIKGDIRDPKNYNLKGVDAIIHLASVSNDPCSDLNPKLSWEIGPLSTMLLVEEAIKHKVKKFIYSSSGSVYGLKKEKKVVENLSLNPISDYNKSKMICERVLDSYKNHLEITIVRPATVCGLSPRMRFDLTVNLLTISALEKNKMVVFGGNQIRPNIHIDDITDLYIFCLKKKLKGIYNAGFENLSILQIAKYIQKKLGSKIIIKKSNDIRSYRLSSEKLLKTGFRPKKSIIIAIDELIQAYNKKLISIRDENINLKWMIKKKIK